MKILFLVFLFFYSFSIMDIHGQDFILSGNSLSVKLNGYILSCSKPKLNVFEDNKWREARRELPGKGNYYYLDGRFTGGEWCDLLVCNPIEQPIEIELIEYEKTGEKPPPDIYKKRFSPGEKFPEYKTVPLKGKIRVEIIYFTDKACKDSMTYSGIFVIK